MRERMILRRVAVVMMVAGCAAPVLERVGPAMAAESCAPPVPDGARLIAALGLRAGMSVAEIGAKDGEVTVEIARHVGPSGQVYSSVVTADRRVEIGLAVAKAGLDNVTLIDGDADGTWLPEGCCEAAFMRYAYHHFDDPGALNAALRRALRPGGRLAVVDFPPDAGESGVPGDRTRGNRHGVMPETVVNELEAAGLASCRTAERRNRWFLVTAGNPGTNPVDVR